jgi:hypothetical protein
MKPKMGRPKLPKGEAKGVLYAARVSHDDAKRIDSAIARSGKGKPEWLRTALLSASGQG